MGQDIIYNNDGKIVRRSRNLRGVLEHARTCMIHGIVITGEIGKGAMLKVTFVNGDHTSIEFADFTICCEWIRKRRSWHGTPTVVNKLPIRLSSRYWPQTTMVVNGKEIS